MVSPGGHVQPTTVSIISLAQGKVGGSSDRTQGKGHCPWLRLQGEGGRRRSQASPPGPRHRACPHKVTALLNTPLAASPSHQKCTPASLQALSAVLSLAHRTLCLAHWSPGLLLSLSSRGPSSVRGLPLTAPHHLTALTASVYLLLALVTTWNYSLSST